MTDTDRYNRGYIILILLSHLILAPKVNAQYQSYDVSQYSYAQYSTSGEASIDLFDKNQSMIAILIFLPVDISLLPNAYQYPNDGVIRMYYTISNLASVIDLLRNESPIVLNYWVPPGNNSHIATRKNEWVGEGE